MKKEKNLLLLTLPIIDKLDGKLQPIMMDKTRSHPPADAYLLAAIQLFIFERANGCVPPG